MKTRKYKAYIWGKDSDWGAICTDFDIAVQADSFKEIQSLLQYAVFEYLAGLDELREDDKRRLLNRRTPFWIRGYLHMRYLLSKVMKIHMKFLMNYQYSSFEIAV